MAAVTAAVSGAIAVGSAIFGIISQNKEASRRREEYQRRFDADKAEKQRIKEEHDAEMYEQSAMHSQLTMASQANTLGGQASAFNQAMQQAPRTSNQAQITAQNMQDQALKTYQESGPSIRDQEWNAGAIARQEGNQQMMSGLANSAYMTGQAMTGQPTNPNMRGSDFLTGGGMSQQPTSDVRAKDLEQKNQYLEAQLAQRDGGGQPSAIPNSSAQPGGDPRLSGGGLPVERRGPAQSPQNPMYAQAARGAPQQQMKGAPQQAPQQAPPGQEPQVAPPQPMARPQEQGANPNIQPTEQAYRESVRKDASLPMMIPPGTVDGQVVQGATWDASRGRWAMGDQFYDDHPSNAKNKEKYEAGLRDSYLDYNTPGTPYTPPDMPGWMSGVHKPEVQGYDSSKPSDAQFASYAESMQNRSNDQAREAQGRRQGQAPYQPPIQEGELPGQIPQGMQEWANQPQSYAEMQFQQAQQKDELLGQGAYDSTEGMQAFLDETDVRNPKFSEARSYLGKQPGSTPQQVVRDTQEARAIAQPPAGPQRAFEPSSVSTGMSGWYPQQGSAGGPANPPSEQRRARRDATASFGEQGGNIYDQLMARPQERTGITATQWDQTMADIFEQYGQQAADEYARKNPRPRMSDEGSKDVGAQGEASDIFRNTPGYNYSYKDEMQGAAGTKPGPQYGIMAQDLERTPEGATMVEEDEQGMKHVDTQRLSMAMPGALHEILGRLDQLDGGTKRKRASA